jgi:anionic cell wall polymer biosynthesis LytR-Cps2A-Psr (LCP) family protein
MVGVHRCIRGACRCHRILEPHVSGNVGFDVFLSNPMTHKLEETYLVNDDYDQEKFVVKAGQPYYNGTDALNDVRFREDGGDEVRTGRHQIFVNALHRK